MAQQQHVLCSSGYSGHGGARSKASKPKKVPQRGLGVAQLEKIREEEERKQDALEAANVLANNTFGNNSSGNETVPCFDVHFPNLRQSLCPSPDLAPLPNALHPSAALSSVPARVSKHLYKGSKCPCNLEGEKDLGYAFWPQVNVPYGTNAHVLVPQRPYQFQRPPSVVKAPSSTVLSPQIEPPSNQSPSDNSYAQPWPEDHKVVGMKRPYPYPLDKPEAQAPLFPSHFQPSTYSAAPTSRSDEHPSCSSGYTSRKEPRSKHMRESPSNSSLLSRDSSPGNRKLNGDFLTLAPPDSKKHPLDHKVPCCQEDLGRHIVQPASPTRLTEQQMLHISLFPVRPQKETAPGHSRNGNGTNGEAIDLNLKL